MKNTLLLLASAATLALTSCGDKAADSTVTTTTTTAVTPGATAVVVDNDEMYKQRSMRVADKYIADMKVSDAAMQEKIRTAYYNRSKRYGETRTKYQTDTTGMAGAMREADMATDTEFKGIYTDPTQYQAYETSRSTYNERDYMDGGTADAGAGSGDAMSAGATPDASAAGTGMSGTAETGKTKMADGSKMKVSADGDVKVKDAEGNVTKVDGDDGTVKIKPSGEAKTKIK